MLKEETVSNLFLNWLKIELNDKTLGEALNTLNEACGTSYKHNWPSKMKANNYNLERLPKCVRQYMMKIVFNVLTGAEFNEKELNKVIKNLT